MTDKEIIHNLRNPYGKSAEAMRETRLQAATRIEQWTDVYENMKVFAESNGLDVVSCGPADCSKNTMGSDK